MFEYIEMLCIPNRVTLIGRTASATVWPCDDYTSVCLSFATKLSGFVRSAR
jgi:hypothetical protein